jgi:hypothetical protein
MLWLIIPVITVMAITGLGHLSAHATLLVAISFAPSGVAVFISGQEPRRKRRILLPAPSVDPQPTAVT